MADDLVLDARTPEWYAASARALRLTELRWERERADTCRQFGLEVHEAPVFRRPSLLAALEDQLTSHFKTKAGRFMDWQAARDQVKKALYGKNRGSEESEPDWSAANVRSLLMAGASPCLQADLLRQEVYGGPLEFALDRRTLMVGSTGRGVFGVRQARHGGRLMTVTYPASAEGFSRALTLVAFLTCARRFPNTPVAACHVDLPKRAPFAGNPVPLAEGLRPIGPFSPDILRIHPRRNGSVEVQLSAQAAEALASDMATWKIRMDSSREAEPQFPPHRAAHDEQPGAGPGMETTP